MREGVVEKKEEEKKFMLFKNIFIYFLPPSAQRRGFQVDMCVCVCA